MTRVFMEDGASLPVTVIEVTPNRITQIKDIDNDGYRALQVTTGSRRAKRTGKVIHRDISSLFLGAGILQPAICCCTRIHGSAVRKQV